MRKITSGFTIVELLVVIAVIGILSAISLVSFSRYQAGSRDTQRSSRVAIIAEALEKYYDENGEYPSCAAMTAAAGTLTTTTLPGLQLEVLRTPQAEDNQTNSIDQCTDLTLGMSTDSYAYVGDGSSLCDTSSCLQYTLQYREEGTGTIKTITSRRTTNILTSGNITDAIATPFSFSQVNLSWSPISGASSYTIQAVAATSTPNDATFNASPITPVTASSNSGSVTGLALDTQYYFRVRPVGASGAGNWSNTPTATTFSLDTPVCTAAMGPIPMSQLQCSWSNVANATSYTISYADNPSFTGATTVPNATSPYIVSGLSPGTTRYFRVQSIAAGYTSGWSATASAITQLPAPVCNTSTLNSNTQITVSWSASAGAVTYTLESATNSGFTGATSYAGIAGTSRAVTGLNNGTTYYFRVKSINGSVESTWGGCPSRATGVDGPTSVTWSGRGEAVRCYGCVAWMPGQDPGYGSTWWTVGMYISGTCQPGATVVTRLYSYYAYSNGSSPNNASLMDWTWGTQDRYMVSGNDSWYGWFQGWVACQVGGTRAGDTYLGNAGPY